MALLKKILIITVVVYALYNLWDRHLKCNMSSIISSVCSAYEAGQVSGPLCLDLCKEKSIHFDKCLSTNVEKIVYDGEWKGKQVILKRTLDWFKLFEEAHHFLDYDNLLSSSQHHVSSHVEALFGNCTQCDKLKLRLVKLFDDNNDGKVTATEVRSFVTLLHLQEPMMLIALNESKHTVDFYGYCGGLYVVEKVPYIASQVFGAKWELKDLSLLPDFLEQLEEIGINMVGTIVDVVFAIPYVCHVLNDALMLAKYYIFTLTSQTYIPNEQEKFEFVYSLMDTTLGISSYPYGMLQSCDLHLGNYGFTNISLVKMIDFDHTYPMIYLGELLTQKQCTSNNDCWVGNVNQCYSWCNDGTGTCNSVVWKHDVTNICQIHIPIIFRGPIIFASENSSCQRKAIFSLVKLCQSWPVITSIQQLEETVLRLKGQLKSIQNSCSEL